MRTLTLKYFENTLLTEGQMDDNAKFKYETSSKVHENHAMIHCGEMIAQLLAVNRDTLVAIVIFGTDANFVFRNDLLYNRPFKNLKMIQLCGLSVKRINWWLPDFEESNRSTRNTFLGKQVPPMVIIKSSMYGPASKNHMIKFFGFPDITWMKLSYVSAECLTKFLEEFAK
ncbi:unnamed protein product [Ambrosiozyma monospora]|uniref:Unnamed protein product n=1 Tax=Ambrosiozyma monospora TaxID=43982 RepID=A0ACB5SX85_AMBMO|nr:unnamed protein product [Ambrosiozyma monospora]